MAATPNQGWQTSWRWIAAALAVLVFARWLLPRLAATTGDAVFLAMLLHVSYLYAVAGLMLLIGCIDGILLYRKSRRDARSDS